MTKILIATIMRPEGDTGVQTHFSTFLSWMIKSGYSASLVTPFDAPKWKIFPIFFLRRLIDPISSTLSVWWYRYWHTFFLFHVLRKLLANGESCVVYAQCPLSADAAMRARSSNNQRIVMVTHLNISQAEEWAEKGMIARNGWLFNSINKFELSTLSDLDGLIFVSEFMRKELFNRIPGLINVPSCVMPNFLPDPGLIDPNMPCNSDLICIGTLELRKNQRYALEILTAAHKLGFPLRLTIVGDGPDRKELEFLARKLGIEEYVCFLGYVKDAAKLLTGHKALLHVALMESFGIVLIEAMSRSIPVFAPSVGGISEILRDGVEGRIIPLDDPKHAAELIVECIICNNKLIQFKSAARSRFLSNYELEANASRLFDYLNHGAVVD